MGDYRALAAIVAASFLIKLALLPYFSNTFSGDSYDHALYARGIHEYGSFAINLMGQDTSSCESYPCQVEQRPPLFDTVLSFFGPDYISSGKLLNSAITSLLAVPVFFMARRFGKDRIALAAACIVSFSPYVMSQAFDVEVRSLTAVFALTSLLFFMSKRFGLSAVFLGLTYLTHYPEAAALLVFYAAFYLLKLRKEVELRRLAVPCALLILTLSPFMARNVLEFGAPLHANTGEYFLTTSVMDQFSLHPSPSPLPDLLRERGITLLRTLSPIPWMDGELNFDYFGNRNLFGRSIVSLVSIPLIAFAVFWLRKSKQRDLYAMYAAIAIAVPIIAVGHQSIPEHTSLLPLEIMLMIAGTAFVFEQKKKTPLLLCIVAAGLALQAPILVDKMTSVNEFGHELVLEETGESDVVMARWSQLHGLGYLTGRDTAALKYGSPEEMLQYARDRGADWILLDGFDSVFEGSRDFVKYISGLPKVERGGFTLVRTG